MTNTQKINTNRLIWYSALCLIMIGCNVQKKQAIDTKALYDVEVLYLYQWKEIVSDDKYRFKFSKDSLYLMIESDFKDCNLIIEENGSVIFEENVSTDPVTGFANEVVREIKTVRSIGVRINSGPLVSFELANVQNNIIGIRKNDKKVQVVFYKKSPIYY